MDRNCNHHNYRNNNSSNNNSHNNRNKQPHRIPAVEVFK